MVSPCGGCVMRLDTGHLRALLYGRRRYPVVALFSLGGGYLDWR